MSITLEHSHIKTLYKAETLWDKVLYDHGPEEQFDTMVLHYNCEQCNQALSIGFNDFINTSVYNWKENNSESSLNILKSEANLKSRTYDDLEVINTINDLTPYIAQNQCTYCNQEYMIVIGFGEKQPTRYIAHVQAILLIDKK